MASKKFLDGMPPEEGVKYQLVTGGDNKTTITNITNWSQTPTEMRANDFIQGMVLLCDHSKVGVTHNLTNPNSVVGMVRAKVGAGQEVEDGDTFTFNGAPLTVVGEIPNIGEGEHLIATIDGSTINFKSGGGGDIGFTFISSATRPENPAENTLWYETDVSDLKVALTKPDDLADGEGWAMMGTPYGESIWSEKGNISLRIDMSKFYWQDAGVVKGATGGIFQNGEWKDFERSIGFAVQRSTGAVTYTERATGMTPASMGTTFNGGDWLTLWPFNEIKPCVLNGGVVQYYLDPNDYTKKIDGTDADITTGADGDVMVEFPLIYTKEWSDGVYDYVSLTPAPLDGYHANGFTNANGVVQDTVYMAAYDGFNISSNLRSVSGKEPTVPQTIATFRTWANARGAGYQQHQWSHRTLLYNLFILMFKGLNSQTLLGRGNVNTSAAKATGTMNDRGMYWGDQTGSSGVKFCGIENLWGNIWKFCDGLGINSSNKIVYKPGAPYNNALSSYQDAGVTRGTTGYVSQMTVDNRWGKIASQLSGSDNTFYCDQWWFNATAGTYMGLVGGSWTYKSQAGLFAVNLNFAASYSHATVGASLSYIPQ